MNPQVADIVRRATAMWDRAASLDSDGDQSLSRRRLSRWRTVIGSTGLLEKRIRNGSVDRDSALGLLNDGIPQVPDPPWADTLDSVIRVVHRERPFRVRGEIRDRSLDEDVPFPFQEVFLPFLEVARVQLVEDVGELLNVLEPKALATLERQLVSNLTFVAGLVIADEFYAYRFTKAPASVFESAWVQQPRSTVIYSSFVSDMADGGLIALLDRYPVVTRLLCQLVDQWVASTQKMCERYDRDFDRLRRMYAWPLDSRAGSITDVRANLSDRHRGGQSVLELVLRTGHRVIYKPRPVTAELTFQRFLAWLNGKSLALDLGELRVAQSRGYGWVESVAAAPCGTHESVRRFYRRAGMLLATLHVLAVTDIHCDNLVACGEQPFVVDLETMLYSTPRGVRPSVLHTGMLPQWQQSPSGNAFDLSALGSDETQDPEVRWVSWTSVNTDQMMLREDARAGSTDHRVRIGATFPSVRDHVGELLNGFEEAYLCFERDREELIRDAGLRAALDHLDLRVLVRDTSTYVQLQLHSLQPDYLRNGIDRSIELEWLARPLMSLKAPHQGAADLYESERAAMEALDVPYFSVGSVKFDGLADSRNMARIFGRRRDAEVLVRRLRKLSPSDLKWQKSMIQKSIAERFGSRPAQADRSRSLPRAPRRERVSPSHGHKDN